MLVASGVFVPFFSQNLLAARLLFNSCSFFKICGNAEVNYKLIALLPKRMHVLVYWYYFCGVPLRWGIPKCSLKGGLHFKLYLGLTLKYDIIYDCQYNKKKISLRDGRIIINGRDQKKALQLY